MIIFEPLHRPESMAVFVKTVEYTFKVKDPHCFAASLLLVHTTNGFLEIVYMLEKCGVRVWILDDDHNKTALFKDFEHFGISRHFLYRLGLQFDDDLLETFLKLL